MVLRYQSKTLLEKPLCKLNRDELFSLYQSVRKKTEDLCKPLEIEDYVVQTIEDVSPPKWHLGHTSWFYETFILSKYLPDYKAFNDKFNFIFNSYYETAGKRVHRPKRGTLSRPTVKKVYVYRNYIDAQICKLIKNISDKSWHEIGSLIELGLHHEMQHQELLLTDLKHIYALNPLKPAYLNQNDRDFKTGVSSDGFILYKGGVSEIGYGGDGFSFDNEKPCHNVYVNDFRLQNKLVTNKEYLDFINDGAYSDARLWLSDGWDVIQNEGWDSPLYWEKYGNEWFIMTLSGLKKLDLSEPVCHVSFYEADAFARWSKKRLPTEFEWEVAASSLNVDLNSCNFMEKNAFHPLPPYEVSTNIANMQQLFGEVWEWTSSPYVSYPGYLQPEGAFGEYNGKFMCNQITLRGGSCVTPQLQIRKTYRNFFQCDKRWQFTGFRLAVSE